MSDERSQSQLNLFCFKGPKTKKVFKPKWKSMQEVVVWWRKFANFFLLLN